ncbi:unnamed protein product [Schistosoma turkestanicum]|nr:unnamed protein product [Schistosoma turkestanicum]
MDLAADVQAINLVECSVCGRHFREDIINRHKAICMKNATKKRKPFDSTKQRIKGIQEVNQKLFGASGTTTTTAKSVEVQRKIAQAEARKHHWRQHHEEFINTIRANRAYVIAKKTGKPLPPPPPRTIDPDLIQCEYCLRRFNEKAAERHIEFCREKHSRLPAHSTLPNTTGISRTRATTRPTAQASDIPTLRNNNRKGLNTTYTPNNPTSHPNIESSTGNVKRGIPQLSKTTHNPITSNARNSIELRKSHDDMLKSRIPPNHHKEEIAAQSSKRGSSTTIPQARYVILLLNEK